MRLVHWRRCGGSRGPRSSYPFCTSSIIFVPYSLVDIIVTRPTAFRFNCGPKSCSISRQFILCRKCRGKLPGKHACSRYRPKQLQPCLGSSTTARSGKQVAFNISSSTRLEITTTKTESLKKIPMPCANTQPYRLFHQPLYVRPDWIEAFPNQHSGCRSSAIFGNAHMQHAWTLQMHSFGLLTLQHAAANAHFLVPKPVHGPAKAKWAISKTLLHQNGISCFPFKGTPSFSEVLPTFRLNTCYISLTYGPFWR